MSAPDVTLLDVIESFVSGAHKLVNVFWVAHTVVLSPVLGELQLCFLWGSVATESMPVHDERHVAAVFTEETQALHVGLDDVTGASRGRDLIRRQVTVLGCIVNSGEVIENVLLHILVSGGPATHLFSILFI